MIAVSTRPGAAALTLLLACGPTSNPDGDSASSSSSTTATTSSTGSSSTDSPTTTGPTPTTDPNPTTGPNPTSISTSASPSTSDSTADLPAFCGDGTCDDDEWQACSCMEDCENCALPQGLSGCPADWTGGSAVAGMTDFGPFDGHTAFFGWNGVGNTGSSTLLLFVYDPSADLEAAKNDPFSEVPFALHFVTTWDHPMWINKGTMNGLITQNNKLDQYPAMLEITGTAGNWQQSDPNDPPRLLGTISPKSPDDLQVVAGPFDAVFCDRFVDQVFPE